MRLYRAYGSVCRKCPAFGVCTKDRRKGRVLEIGPHDAVLRRHRAWMETTEAKQAYRLRQQLVEPVFGILKEQLGARRFLLRGLASVKQNGWCLLLPSTSASYGRHGGRPYHAPPLKCPRPRASSHSLTAPAVTTQSTPPSSISLAPPG